MTISHCCYYYFSTFFVRKSRRSLKIEKNTKNWVRSSVCAVCHATLKLFYRIVAYRVVCRTALKRVYRPADRVSSS